MKPTRDDPADRWDGRDAGELARLWAAPAIHLFRVTGSTNDVARTLAEGGAPAGTLVLAERQTAGRGRRGRAWHDEPGSSILLSIVLRPAVGPGTEPGTLPLRVGLAAALAIEAAAGVDVRIKWPNDLLVDGRKVGGILCEAALHGRGGGWVVAGVGINVSRTPGAVAREGPVSAGSVGDAARRPVDRTAIVGGIVAGVRRLCTAPGPIAGEVARELARRDPLAGSSVTVDGTNVGVACGLSADGALLVKRDGHLTEIRSGTVRQTPVHS